MNTRAPGGVDEICSASLVGVPVDFGAAEPVAAEPADAEPVAAIIGAAEPVLAAEPTFTGGAAAEPEPVIAIAFEPVCACAFEPAVGASGGASCVVSCHAATPPPAATRTAMPAIVRNRQRGERWLGT